MSEHKAPLPTARPDPARPGVISTPTSAGGPGPERVGQADERGAGRACSDTESAAQPGSQAFGDFQSNLDQERMRAAKERIQAAMRAPGPGGRPPKHGGLMLRAHGADALDPLGQAVVDDLRQALDVPEGVLEALKERAVRSLLVVSVIEGYIQRQVNEGKDLADIAVLARWPTYHNAAERSLVALAAALPKSSPHEDERKRVIDLLDTLRQVRPDERQAEPDEEPPADE